MVTGEMSNWGVEGGVVNEIFPVVLENQN
jgi:hypothetical protein